MRVITAAEDDFYEAVCLATKLGRAESLARQLEQRYEEQWDDPQACLRYGLVCMATLDAGTTDTANHGRFHAAMTALDDAVSAAPDYWLARYCRARLRALVPNEYDVYHIFAEPEWTKAAADLDALIADQSHDQWLPYFTAPYVLAAFVAARREDPAAVEAQLAAVAARPAGRVRLRALGAVLCEPFVALYEEPDPGHRPAIAELMRTMFPDQPAVVQALAQPVR